MADLDIARLRALLDAERKSDDAMHQHEEAPDEMFDGFMAAHDRDVNALVYATLNALPALLDAADPETLRFGPWFESWRHAVAVDGALYVLIRDGNRYYFEFSYSPRNWPQYRTEAEAIEAAREHDRARRGAK